MKYSLSGFLFKWTLLTVLTSVFIVIPCISQGDDTKVIQVAILPFRNSTNLSGINQFTDSLKYALQKRFLFRLVDDDELYSVLKKRNLNKKNPMNDEFAFAAGKFVKADYIINGELKFINESFDFEIQFRDVNQQKVLNTFHLSEKNKQDLFQGMLRTIVKDLAKNFTVTVVLVDSVSLAGGEESKIQQDTKKMQAPQEIVEETKEPTESDEKIACNEQLYYKLINHLKQSEFSLGFSEAKNVLNSSNKDKCIVQTIKTAYLDAATQFTDLKDNYPAYLILSNGVNLIPDEELKKALAKIYRSAANDAFYNICIKKNPSDFSSSIQYVKKYMVLNLHKDHVSKVKGWYAIIINKQVYDTSTVGYIKASCVKTTFDNKLLVTGKGNRFDTKKLFTRAIELNHALRWQIVMDENRYLMFGITLVVIIFMVILLRVKTSPKRIKSVKAKPVMKSKWQQRLEEMARQQRS